MILLDGYNFATKEAKDTLVKSLTEEFPNCTIDIMNESPMGCANRAGDVVMGNWKFNKNDFPDRKTYGVKDGIGYIVTPK